jgi:predicted phage baseplate assembly protein
MLDKIRSHLDARRPIGTRLMVEPPYYQGVTVVASFQVAAGYEPDEVREDALTGVYRYLNPLTGGPEGQGWPFGRPVHAGEVFAVLQQVPGVDLVDDVKLFTADPRTGERAAQPVTRVLLEENALVFSYEHQLRVRGA